MSVITLTLKMRYKTFNRLRHTWQDEFERSKKPRRTQKLMEPLVSGTWYLVPLAKAKTFRSRPVVGEFNSDFVFLLKKLLFSFILAGNALRPESFCIWKLSNKSPVVPAIVVVGISTSRSFISDFYGLRAKQVHFELTK